jgi:3-phosphoshikimate 1-carboxyvinyltransferase
MRYKISVRKNTIEGSIELPASKSISNRVLIIQALCQNLLPAGNLSDSDDTRVLQEALLLRQKRIDIGHAGTSMRFLTAYLSQVRGEWEITGSERMKQRPVGILVDALKQLGARIEYMEQEGFPPLKILGSPLTGTTLELDGSISSQYISALLMIAPTIEKGLNLELKGRTTSRSYIEMTLKLMNRFGITYEWSGNRISVKEQNYIPRDYTVEADWSAASYWYQILAIAEKGEILLQNLQLDSLQGDARITSWFMQFGIHSEQTESGVLISKTQSLNPEKLVLDFIENPDIAQTMACLCVAKEIPFHFSGLKTLKIKETDRIDALRKELLKFGADLYEPQEGELAWDGSLIVQFSEEAPLIRTYHDHRMALAFAPLALSGTPVGIDDPVVVTKSYPAFWKDMEKVGFQISAE